MTQNPDNSITTSRRKHAKWIKIFGSSVIDQAVLSLANFIVGLLLIRHADDAQYGYYILVFNSILLLTSLQNSFIGTPYTIHLPRLDADTRKQWLGSLLHDQNRWVIRTTLIALGGVLLLWLSNTASNTLSTFLAITVLAVAASLYREFFRNTLLIHQHSDKVLLVDLIYIFILTGGCFIAIRFSSAATLTIAGTALASLACARIFRYQLRDLMNLNAAPGQLRVIAPIGLWAASGASVYWLFNQGYSFVTAYTLDIAAVGALAAARLLMMPVNLVTSGVQKQLVPVASNWLHQMAAPIVLRRLILAGMAFGAMVVVYAMLAWWLKDWLFLKVLRKDLPQRDEFLLLWSFIFLVKAIRDPISLLLTLKQQFRLLVFSSTACAVLSLILCFALTLTIGASGALWGVLAGETLSLVLILLLSLKVAGPHSPKSI